MSDVTSPPLLPLGPGRPAAPGAVVVAQAAPTRAVP